MVPGVFLKSKKLIFIYITFVFSSAVFSYVWYWEFRPHGLEVYFFQDATAGGSPQLFTFIRTAKNKTILIDGGKSNQVIKKITHAMPFYRRRIDVVILTQLDDAHATGLVSVASRYTIGHFLFPALPGGAVVAPSSSYEELKNIVRDRKIAFENVNTAVAPKFTGIDGIQISFFFPDQNFKFSKTNKPLLAFSLEDVARSVSILFASGLSKTEQKYVLENSFDQAVKNRLLVFAPAGNAATLNEDFLAHIDPTQLIFSKKINSKNNNINAAAKVFSRTNIATEGDTRFFFDVGAFKKVKIE